VILRVVQSIAATWLAGLVALLPLVVTVGVLGWLVGLVYRLIGPGSLIGQLVAKLGYPFSRHPGPRVSVRDTGARRHGLPTRRGGPVGLKRPLKALANHTVRRVPLVGDLYSLADRFVALWHEKQEADIGAMRPVWCFFGGEGTAVLALAPSAQEIEIEGRSYLAVLVPTAPVPFGGALIYVPHDWVRPRDIGVDKLRRSTSRWGSRPRDYPSTRVSRIPQKRYANPTCFRGMRRASVACILPLEISHCASWRRAVGYSLEAIRSDSARRHAW